MGISERQVYRDLRNSEEVIARFLWEQWFEKNHEYASIEDASEKEETSLPTVSHDIVVQPIDLRELLYQTLQVIENLANLRKVRFDVSCSEKPINIFTDITIARQILIHLISHAIQNIYDTKLMIELHRTLNECRLQIKYSKEREESFKQSISSMDDLIVDLMRTLNWSLKEYCESTNLNVVEINIHSNGAILLLIDDAQGQGDLIKRYLVQTPLQVFHAKSGHEGIQLAKSLTPNIIFLDVMMSQMDGWETLQRLRNDPQTANIPIVVWSVFHDPELAISLGANRFLSKLANREEILKILRDLNIV
jgi:CheY-like chemotaxis protein